MTACSTRGTCGFSGSAARGTRRWGSGMQDPGCLQCDCREFQQQFSGEDLIHVCKFGRYVVPDTRFADNSAPRQIVSFMVPFDAPRGVLIDLGPVTAAAVAARPDLTLPPYSLYSAFAGTAVGTPTDAIIPRVRLYNKSDHMVQLTTGVDGVLFSGVSKQIGAQPGEMLDLMYHPVQNRWDVVGHSQS